MNEPPMGMEEPPMNEPLMGMEEPPMNEPMGGSQPPMNEPPMGMEEENPYDTNFDPGVEANEEEDPKHFIEQLSGKLSQSLRSYQEGLPKPDAETAKYAAGMVLKAAIEGLSQKDVKDILNKLDDEENEFADDGDDENFEDEMPNMEGDEKMEFDGLENKKYYNSMIDEIVQNIIQPNKEEPLQKRNTNNSYRKNPFVAPKLK